MKLLERLKEKGVAGVVIAFDGEGDNGDITGIYCYLKEETVAPGAQQKG